MSTNTPILAGERLARLAFVVDLLLSLSAFEPSAVLIEKHESEFDAIGQRLIFSSLEVVEWFRRTSRVQSKGAN